MPDYSILNQMRADWNARAREDANYYVAFGRRGQDDAEFFASGADVAHSLEAEFVRLRSRDAALEIGCGPGRLMLPMARHFREIHGVDVSDEMIQRAREHLRRVPNAHAHHTGGTDLARFPDEFFDFVYSYAVFQHIPSREVVFSYLEEARRVLKTGGILRAQVNGLPEQAARYDTWAGVRISAGQMTAFAREQDFQLLALEGVSTQYLWTTWRKQPAGWAAGLRFRGGARIRSVSNAAGGEAAVPASGPRAAISIWIEQLPADCDLNTLTVQVDGLPGGLRFLSEPARDGISQLNAALPDRTRTGMVPIDVGWLGEPLCPAGWIRVIPPGPAVPRLVSVTDGVHLLAGTRITSGSVKAVVEELSQPERFSAFIDAEAIYDLDFFQTDPLLSRYEINFRLPAGLPPGTHRLDMRMGRRAFPAVTIERV